MTDDVDIFLEHFGVKGDDEVDIFLEHFIIFSMLGVSIKKSIVKGGDLSCRFETE